LGRSRKRGGAHVIAVMAIAWSFVVSSVADAQVFSADAVKAAFLHRFASYVEWPPDAMRDGPFVIAVVGSEEVATHLEGLLPGLVVQGRAAEVRRITRVSELDGVHVLYIGPEAATRARELRTEAVERPILLVTDGEESFEGGGIINFRESGNRVRFEVSLTAADRAGLRIDSALLPVAARVERQPQVWLPRDFRFGPALHRAT
jgi:hypothetical protein